MGDHRITRGIEVALLIGSPDPRVFQAMIDFTEAFIESVSLSSLPLRLWRRALAASNHLVQAVYCARSGIKIMVVQLPEEHV